MQQPAPRKPKEALEQNIRLATVEAPVYDQNHFEIFHPWEQRRIAKTVSKWRHAPRILDVGAGTGNVISKFPHSSMRIGVDLSERMLGEARKKDPRLHLVKAESGCLPFKDRSFDVIYTYSTLHHFPDWSLAIQEAVRTLKGNGRLILDHEEHFQEGGWRGHLYRILRRCLRVVARFWYWNRPKALPWLPYRRISWPFSSTFGSLDFQVIEGGHVDPNQIETLLSTMGLRVHRHHYLLEPLPMSSVWQVCVHLLCRMLRMGHFYIEGIRPIEAD